MRVFTKPSAIRLDDEKAERNRREVHQAIAEIQGHDALGVQLLGEVKLQDGVETPISHGLARAPKMIRTSPVRGAVTSGRIEEVRSGRVLRERTILLKAVGYGATIAVDVEVL